MIIDAHTHIFPPDVINAREKYLRPEEIAFSSIYANPGAKIINAEDLIRNLDDEGVDKAVTFGFPWVNEDFAKRHNDYVMDMQSKYPDRLIGMGCFDPLRPWAEKEAQRVLEFGLSGLGELAVYSAGFDEESIGRLSSLGLLCKEFNQPLMVHVNESVGHQYPGKAPLTLKMIYDLAKAMNGVKLILAHWGGGLFFYNLMKKEVKDVLKNVFFDTAASPFLYQPDIYRIAVTIIGADKILFGSDYPLIKPGRYFKEMEESGISVEEAALIKGEAANILFSSAPDWFS